MLWRTQPIFRRSRNWQRRSCAAIAALLLLSLGIAAARAQQPAPGSAGASDLGQQNLSRVAASVEEIKAVLAKDAGLMVALKQWVARDATEHGQVVSDSDLTDDGIFERLETEVAFRSVATALVQRYGYLVPKINPDSDSGKEHELVLQERARRLVETRQDEGLAGARWQGDGTTQEERPCDLQMDKNCAASSARSPASRAFRQESPLGEEPLVAPPLGPNPSALPGAEQDPLLRAQLALPVDEGSAGFYPLPLAGYDSVPNLQSLNARASATADSEAGLARSPGDGRVSASAIATGAGGGDGLLAAYGLGTNSGIANLPEMAAGAGAGNMPPVPGAPTLAAALPRPSAPAPAEPPEMVRRKNPYESIPSLYDMYVQAVARPSAPRRFGAEVFASDTRDSQLIPMDLPAGPDYVVGPGDGLSVDLWGGVSQRFYRVVDREGRVSLPEAGPVLVSGKTLDAVQQSLQQVLRTQFRDVSADVSLARLRTVRVYEVGDVVNPGAYDVSSLSTPLNALFAAGGPTPRGSLRLLKHYRGAQLLETVDLYDLLLHGVKAGLQRLENGDTVQVPPIGPQVTVEGMVRRPAIYELRDEKDLAGVLELAGGLLPAAALRHIEVQRLVAHEKQTMRSLDIPESADPTEIARQLQSFEIRDGDRIRIFPVAPYNQDAVFLEGHVARPGRYSYRQGMRVSDVLASYKDLLPEPAAGYAEIIRLNPPDFHPSVESFDLTAAMDNPAQSPALQAMDTIRVFSRFDFENPPSVSVGGGVRVPGTYPTSGRIRLADAVHLAGGLTPDAQTADAQVFRYAPDGKIKVLSVGLGKALEGDPAENILLEPRDRLLVHRSPDAADPATVYIQGEVMKPGRYPLAQGMCVRDLIRLGGGFKNSADLEIADLIEYPLQNRDAGKGAHHEVLIAAALAGAPANNWLLHNGDTLTIRQISGWNDLGASVTVRGEVAHPGSYGIRPGERLSSVLLRAGGFLPTAYPKSAVFEREDVRQLERKNRDELIARIRLESSSFKTSIQDSAQEQAALAQQSMMQRNAEIVALEQAPLAGRLVVRVPASLAHFAGSPDDIELRRGDSLFVPKRPEFVLVSGQVYNSNALTYQPRRDARWYLRQAGGPTDQGNVKMAFVIRASGAVVSSQGSVFWSGGVLSTVIEPGDAIVIPEKAIGGSNGWKNLIGMAQLAEAAATTAFIATH